MLIGKLMNTGRVVQVTYDRAISAVDDLLSPPESADLLAPAFIDVQVNGFAGVDYNDPSSTAEAIAGSLRSMFSTGVSRCLPTVITGSQTAMLGALRNLARAKAEFARHGMAEAEAIEGFHVEGPHISPVDGPRGAHPREHVRPPDVNEFKRWQEATEGAVKVVTISPEWEETPRYIENLVREGVVASIGHTRASAEQIETAVEAGATMSTHLGNGADAALPKTANYIWDQLAEDRLSGSFIVDGIHLPPHFLRAALRAKGTERAILVTDAVMPAMCEPGFYRLGQVDVELRLDGSVVLKGGMRLAGSALRMDMAVANCVLWGGVSLAEACTMATVNAARTARINGRWRGIAPGEKADLIRFQYDDRSATIKVFETVVAGQTVYKA